MKSFAEALAETCEFVDRAIARIAAGEGALIEVHNVRTYLINLLELVERDPGLDAAADDLHATILACVSAVEVGSLDARRRRLLDEAAARLRARLSLAKPNEAARRLGLRA